MIKIPRHPLADARRRSSNPPMFPGGPMSAVDDAADCCRQCGRRRRLVLLADCAALGLDSARVCLRCVSRAIGRQTETIEIRFWTLPKGGTCRSLGHSRFCVADTSATIVARRDCL